LVLRNAILLKVPVRLKPELVLLAALPWWVLIDLTVKGAINVQASFLISPGFH
jgi:hypothetical protein